MHTFEFQYNLDNLHASVLDTSNIGTDTFIIIGGLLAGIIIITFLYNICLYIYGYMLIRREGKEKLAKKNTIQELILMKTIQDELEHEIEESFISTAFTRVSQAG